MDYIVRLKAYLRENGGCLLGNKDDLLRLAILYADDFESGLGTNSSAVSRVHKQLKNYRCELCSYTSYTKRQLKTHSILKHAHQNDGSSDDLIKPDILIKEEEEEEEDQMPETYSDHKNFKEIEIKEEFVADPCAIDIDDKEANFKNKH
jgi:NAD-dependent SIR2 family protein deacetylase